MPPSAGKIIAWSTVWLALNEPMWVTMSFSLGATTARGGGRSWIWNNETVNGLHHWYWFSWALVYVLCPWSSTNIVATHIRQAALTGTMHVVKEERHTRVIDLFLPRWTLLVHIWSYLILIEQTLLNCARFICIPTFIGSQALQSPDRGCPSSLFKWREKG